MLIQFIQNRITQQLHFSPNEGQQQLIKLLSTFITDSNPRKAFILKGYAGTGKTSIMAALVQAMKQLNQRIVLLAPTGRAAKVIAKHANTQAYTIHKFIYRQKQLGQDAFTLNDNLHRNTLFIVDEASMISGNKDNPTFGSGILLDDLITYIYRGQACSMLLVGDDAQLPPVGSNCSKALSEDYIAGYQLHTYAYTLTEVARQALDSGILLNANKVRPIALGEKTECNGMLTEQMWNNLQMLPDITTVNGATLMEALEQAYAEVGEEDTIMLTRTNRRTNIYNQGIRNTILWRDGLITTGDRIMVSKNNYFWTQQYDNLPFIANGDMLQVVRLRNIRQIYGYNFADAQLKALDYEWEIDATIWLDTIISDTPEASHQMQIKLFNTIAEDYPELIHNRKKLIETIYQSPYYNALQIRMAYAVTAHKAQGGQWARVFIDPYIGGQQSTTPTTEEIQDFYRWIYTAITRATEKVYFIKNK